VPQTGHFPFMAGLPFFMVTLVAFGSSLLARHLTQYISAIFSPPSFWFIYLSAKNITQLAGK